MKNVPVLKRIDAALKATADQHKAMVAKQAEYEAKIKALEDRLRQRPGIGMHEEDKRKFSLAKAFRGALMNDWTGAELERDAMVETAKLRAGIVLEKTATLGNPVNLGLIVPNEVAQDIVQPLRPELFFNKLGVTMRTGLKAVPYEKNKKSESGNLNWISEGDTATAQDVMSMSRLLMYPHTAELSTYLSLKLLMTGGQAAEAEARDTVRFIFDRDLEKSFMESDGTLSGPVGTRGAPIGMVGRAANTVAITDNADVKLNTMQQMIGKIAEDNVPTGNLKWFMHENAWQSLTRIQVSVGGASASTTVTPSLPLSSVNAVVTNIINGVMEKRLWGYPVITTTNNTATSSDTYTILLADWSETVFADWGPPDMGFEVAGDTLRRSRRGLIYSFYDCDWLIERGEALCTGTDFDVP